MTKKSSSPFDLSIVIGAYREEKRIGKTLDRLSEYLKTEESLKDKAVEVIVCSADSPDKTHEIILSKQAQFAHFVFLKPGLKLGKGRDIQFAMLRTQGKKAIFMDADLATPLKHIPQFYAACESGSDVVIGTQNLRKTPPELTPPGYFQWR